MQKRLLYAIILSLLLIPMNVSAKWTDPFFDLYHDTDEKIQTLRNLFDLDTTVISDEELKDYYRKDTIYADSLIYQYELGERWDCWYKSQCAFFPDDQDKINKNYFKLFTNDNMLEIYSSIAQSGDFKLWKAASVGVIQIYGIYSTLDDGYKAYKKGFQVMTSHALRSLIFDLYPYYTTAINNESNPYNELFKQDGIYDSLKFVYEEYIQMFILDGMSENDFKGFLLDILKNINMYNNTDLRIEVGNSILQRASLLGCYKELLVYLSESIVEQTNSVVVSGLYFSKNSQVSYSIATNGNEINSGIIETSNTGSFDHPIDTDCSTLIGGYEINIVDLDSGKSTSVIYSVISSLTCDDVAPELISSIPPNMANDVSSELNEVCFTFSEEMSPQSSIKWESATEVPISTTGTWNAPDTICFSVTDTLPYFTTINWTLNDTASTDFFTDLAGNKLSMTQGLFTSEYDANDIDNDGDGFTENQGDCNDDPVLGVNIYPNAEEICDGIDNNCDGEVDEGCGIQQGLVAYYPFNGNANDESGNGNDGTEYGGLSYVQGVSGQAINLDGLDDFIRVNSSDSLNITGSISMCGWVNTGIQNNGPVGIIINKNGVGDDSTRNSYLLNLLPQNTVPPYADYTVHPYKFTGWISYDFPNTIGGAFSETDAEDGIWHYVVCVYDQEAGKIQMYVDGVADGDPTSYSMGMQPNDFPLYIGHDALSATPPRYLKGMLDEIRIYNRALSENEIQELYQQGSQLSLLDQLMVPSDGTEVFSSISLEHGTTFKVRATGTFRYGTATSRIADAKYSLREPGVCNDTGETTWISGDDLAVCYGGVHYLEVLLNGNPVNWGLLNTNNHTYEISIIGDGVPISFQILDDYFSDNSGEIAVGIYR